MVTADTVDVRDSADGCCPVVLGPDRPCAAEATRTFPPTRKLHNPASCGVFFTPLTLCVRSQRVTARRGDVMARPRAVAGPTIASLGVFAVQSAQIQDNKPEEARCAVSRVLLLFWSELLP